MRLCQDSRELLCEAVQARNEPTATEANSKNIKGVMTAVSLDVLAVHDGVCN